MQSKEDWLDQADKDKQQMMEEHQCMMEAKAAEVHAASVVKQQEHEGALHGISVELQQTQMRVSELTEELNSVKQAGQVTEKEGQDQFARQQQELQERNMIIESYTDHVQLLESNCKDLNETISVNTDKFARLEQEIAILKDRKDAETGVPSEFEVLLRCTTGTGGTEERTWCYCSTSRSILAAEAATGESLSMRTIVTTDEWHLDEVVRGWVEKKLMDVRMRKQHQQAQAQAGSAAGGGAPSSSRDSPVTWRDSNSFSIEDDECEDDSSSLNFPQTVQEVYQELVSKANATCEDQNNAMKLELENRQQAFDVYRERAKIALKKTASDQKTMETKLLDSAKQTLLEQDKVRKQQLDFDQYKKEYVLKLEAFSTDVIHEQMATATLMEAVDRCHGEIAGLKKLKEKQFEHQVQMDEQKAQSNMNYDAQEDRIKECEVVINKYKQSEAKTQQEMQKKSDNARKLVESKDSEIRKLQKLLLKKSNTESPSPANTPAITPAVTTPASAGSNVSNSAKLNTGNGNGDVASPIQPIQLNSVVVTGANSNSNNSMLTTGQDSLNRANSTPTPTHAADGDSVVYEQKLVYLKQVLCALFRSKKEVELTHLGRVLGAILELTEV